MWQVKSGVKQVLFLSFYVYFAVKKRSPCTIKKPLVQGKVIMSLAGFKKQINKANQVRTSWDSRAVVADRLASFRNSQIWFPFRVTVHEWKNWKRQGIKARRRVCRVRKSKYWISYHKFHESNCDHGAVLAWETQAWMTLTVKWHLHSKLSTNADLVAALTSFCYFSLLTDFVLVFIFLSITTTFQPQL